MICHAVETNKCMEKSGLCSIISLRYPSLFENYPQNYPQNLKVF